MAIVIAPTKSQPELLAFAREWAFRDLHHTTDCTCLWCQWQYVARIQADRIEALEKEQKEEIMIAKIGVVLLMVPPRGLWWRLPLAWLLFPFAMLIAGVNKILEKMGMD